MAELGNFYSGALVAATTTAAGGVISLLNPEGRDLIITRFLLDVRTASAGAATVDIGVAATVASADTLIDGMSVATAGTFDNIENQGTNGVSALRWPAGYYLTATASATTASMVGRYYVSYTRLLS